MVRNVVCMTRNGFSDLSFDSQHRADFDSAPLSSYLRGFGRYRSYRVNLIWSCIESIASRPIRFVFGLHVYLDRNVRHIISSMYKKYKHTKYKK